ncbi:MAG: bifunctional glutamine synthetase adenylyltransferase/deadenyltransferase, partial [Gammaproteobacteria bacterium]|nr:bifunctional glutamine synthetase adenylyltransferase/deadenyltransferase [Gammaproteobacteria bacterium]
MAIQSSDMLVRMQQSVPPALHDKLATHYDAWLQGCERDNLSPDPGIAPVLLGKIWACSEFVAQTSCRRPSLWFELLQNNDLEREFELVDYQAALGDILDSLSASDDAALMHRLRLFRQKQMLRIAWRDLAGSASTSETLRNLTDLAETCVDLTLEFLYQDQCKQLGTPCSADGSEQRLIVLGMGKLGGHELNFSSDIDLIFGFPEEGETQGARSMANSQFFVRLAQRFIRVI